MLIVFLYSQGERAHGMFALLQGHLRVMRAVAVPKADRSAALSTLEVNKTALTKPLASSSTTGTIASKPLNVTKSSVIKFAPDSSASHMTLLNHDVPVELTTEMRSSDEYLQAVQRTTGEVEVDPSLRQKTSSCSTDDLMQGLLAWVTKRKGAANSSVSDSAACSSDANLESTRTALLLRSTFQAATASSSRTINSNDKCSTFASVPRLVRMPSWIPQAGEETVLVDLQGLRRFDTWGFCDCVMGADVSVRPSEDKPSFVPRRPSELAPPSFAHFKSPRHSTISIASSNPTSLINPGVEVRESPLASVLRSESMGDTPLRSARSMAFESKTAELFVSARPFCQSLVADTWAEVLYIPRDGIDVRVFTLSVLSSRTLHPTCLALFVFLIPKYAGFN